MKWLRSLRRAGRTKAISLPELLTRQLGWGLGEILVIQWDENSKTVLLSRAPNPQKMRENAKGAWPPSQSLIKSPVRRRFDNTEPLHSLKESASS